MYTCATNQDKDIMKTTEEIKCTAEKGDYVRVAEIVGCSPSLIYKVVLGLRTDHHKIQKTFSDLLEARERLTTREARRRERKLQAA